MTKRFRLIPAFISIILALFLCSCMVLPDMDWLPEDSAAAPDAEWQPQDSTAAPDATVDWQPQDSVAPTDEAIGETVVPAPQTDVVPDNAEADAGTPVDNAVAGLDGYFARSSLSEDERAFYDAAYSAAFNMKGKTDVEEYGVKVPEASRIVRYVLCDAPELFWCGGSFKYSYNEADNTVMTLEFTYSYTPEDANAMQEAIDAEAADILKGVDSRMSEYQKFTLIYTELGKRLEYDEAAAADINAGVERGYDGDQTIVGGLAKRKAVCAGISRSLQYLLHKAGIQCYFVTGTLRDSADGSTGPHAWNLVRIDGDWYYADLTNDMTGIKADSSGDFLMTDGECFGPRSLTRQDGGADVNENPELPACTSHRFDSGIQ